ncbi:Bromodomain-containing factor 1 [Psilocybe cubensis]|uniref:Bromodomain-containing factor 1 n=2 Tax=Psilocybe cubensis TaxID=181762 RepID=A0ACB8HGT2_PSICU|nr:Bromodomain-containing factor 1 [Psilocybe cubensis]KAH9487146.1 Bromodomain-containing factor 1 [Psilocybe cubensis]
MLSGHTTNGISDTVFHARNDNPPSPATDSPATPVDSAHAPDVKIDIDYEQESDVRHEPLPVKELDAPIAIHGTADVVMGDTSTPGLAQDFSMASIAPNGSSNGAARAYHDDSDAEQGEPPAKRARVHSDADMASMTHSATPPPASHAPTPPPPSSVPPPTAASTSAPGPKRECTITPHQYRYLVSSIRTLRKMKDGAPFLRPVDPIALNVPHYPSIIKHPMDLSTIERKLTASNPSRPDPNPHNPRYYDAEDVSADIRLMVQNAITFNGPDHIVSIMAKTVQEVYDKSIKHLPPRIEKPAPKPAPVPRKATTPPAPPTPVMGPPATKKAAPAARRASTSVPVIRRSDAEVVGRPKREIHPPPPKDLPYADAPKKNRKGKRTRPDGTAEQLKYCGKILQELNRKTHASYAYPFYEPVDWQKLEIPSYPKIIKRPMDLSTIRKKLDGGEYDTAQNFYDDFKLMIRNCFTFNPSGTPVNLAGQELQKVFDEKWKGLPPLQSQDPSDDEEEDEDDSDEERRRAIAMMESQIETMKNNIESLKTAKLPKEKKKEKKKEKAPVASTSKPPPKQTKAPAPTTSKKKSKKNVTDDDVLTFEQKKDLSESIGKLDGARLERVIQIIHEGVPEIRDSTEEIELEIDQLPAAVLTKLYNFVLRPIRQPAQPKRNRTGKGTGTGGLRRKSMDEEKEAEKIRQLEERMALFEGHGTTSAAPARRNEDSDHSSDSSSGSDSSGSDSE